MAGQTDRMEALGRYVRRTAATWLRQPNVTSMGVGVKIRDGEPTGEICIQFTVGRKAGLDSLGELGLRELPGSLVVDGEEVATDVVERNYATDARPVNLLARQRAAAPRKSAVDPVVPGVSIGHPATGAGTAGCVCYDAVDGTPYILANWHVLHGPGGRIGDPIVQPGRHDDNRVDRNRVGQLVRSHLGVAGDCALATVSERRLAAEILELGQPVRRLGEPELADRVVKSGRTTGVTRGLVQRVHVVARIDYGEAGEQDIGCFEIGPDPQDPGEDSELSRGGDSGAAWLLVQPDQPTDMLLGLHFAGEVADEPEHALACYAASVCEKLGVLPAPPQRPATDPGGFDANFLGSAVALPAAADAVVDSDLLVVAGTTVIPYTHFSLAMSRSRRFARWVAWNIDGAAIRRLSRSNISFRRDDRLPAEAQVGDELYKNNPLDRGHLARRADLLWGSPAEARQANADSFYFTNITPQHEGFNQSGAGGIWGQLEDALFAEVDVADLRVSVMGGPIFTEGDPSYRNVRLPKRFWKILYYREGENPAIRARGYVLTQEDLLSPLEALELPEFSVYEVPVGQIGEMTGLRLRADDPGPVGVREAGVRRIDSVRTIIRRPQAA